MRGVECFYPSTRLHENHSHNAASSTPSSTSSTDSSRSVDHFHHDEYQSLISANDGMQVLLQDNDHLLGYSTNPMSLFPMDTNYYSSSTISSDGGTMNSVQFFLLPGSWNVAEAGISSRNSHSVSQLNKSVHQVQRWVKQWVEEGSNMFIHKRLYYRDNDGYQSAGGGGVLNMPRCIQDAYTTCAAYFACTPKNKEMILKMVEQRVATLLEEEEDEEHKYGSDNDTEDNDQISYLLPELAYTQKRRSRIENDNYDSRDETTKRSVLDHLARVQALLCYQYIRLYDGDLRSRIMAESQIPVLSRWSMDMINSALLSSEYVHSISTMSFGKRSQASIEKKLNSDWHAWILAESVRRTWLVAGHVQCIYRLLSDGISMCPGGLMFTTRAGLWHADTAYEWWTRCREKDVLFCQSLESARHLLKRTRPEEVDEFGKFVVGIIGGEDKVKNWLSNR